VAVCGHPGPAGPLGTADSCGHQGWVSQSSRCWGAPVGPRGRAHVVLPLLADTNGVHQAHVALCGHQGAGVCRGTAGSCNHHGWFAPSSRSWGAPVEPKGYAYAVLTLLCATGGVHQGQMAVWGHWGQWGTTALLAPLATVGGLTQPAGVGGLQWHQKNAPILHYLCWLPLFGSNGGADEHHWFAANKLHLFIGISRRRTNSVPIFAKSSSQHDIIFR